ncbi:hypothetical protein [Staphylococcus equorum]|uniref:DUF3967 domain-containing protein n=1 Tax=Staphylococcus equorum TaxID=246432 RepID=A0A9X4LC26_9STAP|nr:hypothetical protein [Staphylococcus equorum]MDG0860373.1 hypothetical protein [Staphylococcus equorum]
MNVEDLANQLGVSTSTIKKYYLLIEDKGYKFRRNVHGNLTFTQDDVELFKAIFKLKAQPKSSVNDSIDKALGVITDTTDITTDFNVSRETNSEDITDITVMTDMNETLEDIKKFMETQDNTIKDQNTLIREQSRMIDELVRSNRQNQKLLESDNKNSLLEENLAETNELKNMIKELQESSDKKPWWKIW